MINNFEQTTRAPIDNVMNYYEQTTRAPIDMAEKRELSIRNWEGWWYLLKENYMNHMNHMLNFTSGLVHLAHQGCLWSFPTKRYSPILFFMNIILFPTTLRGKVHPGECERLAGSIFLILNQVSTFPEVSS